ncbi:TolB family protein [Kordiimonas aquimaris]|uniref:TolB family protein n=1 Tax=Kordiimonas aquimaris TaxID=707591 RepID=UPI0021D16714|nr:hypothetical protein [Kordiimonas aquimaris]
MNINIHRISAAFSFVVVLGATVVSAESTVDENVRILFSSEKSSGTLALHSMLADGSLLQLHVPAAVRGRGEYEASVSPDGKHIAFTTYRYGGWKIAISDLDGRNIRRLTMDPQYVYDPAWSPDGITIVYRRIVNGSGPYFRGNAAAFIINADGSNNRALTSNNKEHIRNLSFSPDGHYLLYDAFVDNGLGVMRMKKSGSEHMRLTNLNTPSFAPSWFPDGNWIAYMHQDQEGYVDVWKMRVDGTEAQNITQSKNKGLHSIGDTFSHWQYETNVSPDGKWIAFTADYQDKGNADIYTVSLETSEIVRLTSHKGADLHPFWYKVSD